MSDNETIDKINFEDITNLQFIKIGSTKAASGIILKNNDDYNLICTSGDSKLRFITGLKNDSAIDLTDEKSILIDQNALEKVSATLEKKIADLTDTCAKLQRNIEALQTKTSSIKDEAISYFDRNSIRPIFTSVVKFNQQTKDRLDGQDEYKVEIASFNYKTSEVRSILILVLPSNFENSSTGFYISSSLDDDGYDKKRALSLSMEKINLETSKRSMISGYRVESSVSAKGIGVSAMLPANFSFFDDVTPGEHTYKLVITKKKNELSANLFGSRIIVFEFPHISLS